MSKIVRLTIGRKDFKTLEDIGDAAGFNISDSNRGASAVLRYVLRTYGPAIIDSLNNSKVAFVFDELDEEDI
ncbi:hypothetical protein [Anabaena sp. CCY 9402-a]|uniref:hypothetical protein n=1 Tax=Anabaena sp. CCY 9402-a TaxID=3103867 RepID=UPI0039C6A097